MQNIEITEELFEECNNDEDVDKDNDSNIGGYLKSKISYEVQLENIMNNI